MRSLLRFPNPVNEISARLVATGVVTMALAVLVLRQHWVLLLLAYGFIARVLTGPTLSPLGQFVTRIATPTLVRRGAQPRFVPGPPKRFAQGIGATFSVIAAVLYFGAGLTLAADLVIGMLLVAASLEAFAGYCLGCTIFGWLMRTGLIPDDVCEECSNIWARSAA